MRRILITGANRGIGLLLVRRYAGRDETVVYAACRNPRDASELQELVDAPDSRVRVVEIDVSDPDSIRRSAGEIGNEVDGLDLLVNNAGLYGGSVSRPQPETAAFGSLEADAMLAVFRVNAVAPVLMVQAYADLLRRGDAARVINVSSDAGSITRRDKGCNYTYPASKAALNMMTRCLAGELEPDGIIVASVHPGFVRTDMGGPQAPLEPEETVPSLVRHIDALTMPDSGSFLNWDGSPVPW